MKARTIFYIQVNVIRPSFFIVWDHSTTNGANGCKNPIEEDCTDPSWSRTLFLYPLSRFGLDLKCISGKRSRSIESKDEWNFVMFVWTIGNLWNGWAHVNIIPMTALMAIITRRLHNTLRTVISKKTTVRWYFNSNEGCQGSFGAMNFNIETSSRNH